MDSKKLEALRRKYADAKGGDIFDPEFAAVAAQVFSRPERRKWPFSDPATFLGAPFRPDALADAGLRRPRRRADRRADGPWRHQPCRRAARSARGPQRRAHRPLRARAAHRAGRAPRRRRRRRRADAEPLQPRPVPRRHRGVLHARLRGRRHSAGGRRRPFDHLFDPEGGRSRPAGGHGAHRRALRHRRRVSKAPSSTTAGRSGRRCWPACSTRSARSRSASAAAPNTCGSSRTRAA